MRKEEFIRLQVESGVSEKTANEKWRIRDEHERMSWSFIPSAFSYVNITGGGTTSAQSENSYVEDYVDNYFE